MDSQQLSSPVSQPSKVEPGGNQQDHHLSLWTESETISQLPSSWDQPINTPANLPKKENHSIVTNKIILLIILKNIQPLKTLQRILKQKLMINLKNPIQLAQMTQKTLQRKILSFFTRYSQKLIQTYNLLLMNSYSMEKLNVKNAFPSPQNQVSLPTPYPNFKLKWGDRGILLLTLYNEINNLQLANPYKTYSKITKSFHIFSAAKWKIKFYSIYNQQISHTSLLQDNNILKLAHL